MPAGQPATFNNDVVIQEDGLTAAAAKLGSRGALLTQLRESSAAIIELARNLHEATAGILVPTKIRNGAEMAVDQPIPLAAIFQSQALVHLVMHRSDIEALRPAVRS